MFRVFRKKTSGFTIYELLAVIVIIGILAAVAVPRFMGAQDRARVGAAEADLNTVRQALGMYEIDYADYPAAMTLANAPAVIVDPQDNPYMSLPTGANFASFAYVYYSKQTPTSYVVRVMCFDSQNTVLYATPEGIDKIVPTVRK